MSISNGQKVMTQEAFIGRPVRQQIIGIHLTQVGLMSKSHIGQVGRQLLGVTNLRDYVATWSLPKVAKAFCLRPCESNTPMQGGWLNRIHRRQTTLHQFQNKITPISQVAALHQGQTPQEAVLESVTAFHQK